MPRNLRVKKDVDFLKLFKKSLALSFTALVFGFQSSYASTITGDANFGTNVNVNGNNININGGTLNGDTGFHHFYDFILNNGDIANLIFRDGASRYVNLVDGQVSIDGIFNSLKGGSIGGDVIFVSPLGFLVGPTGIVNVGSLQTITPSQASYDALTALSPFSISYDTNIKNLNSDGDISYGTEIYGKIFSSGSIDISDGQSVVVGDAAKLIAGFNQNGFSTLKDNSYDFSKVVNDSGVVSADYLTNAGGKIKISTNNNIYSDGLNGLIQATDDVVLKGEEVSLGAKVKTSGNLDITESNKIYLNNDIDSDGLVKFYATSSVDQAENTNIVAQSLNIDSDEIFIDGNITTEDGIVLNSGNRGQVFSQGNNSSIVNQNSGDIVIKAKNITSNKITNNAQNGNIYVREAETILLQDTLKTTNQGSISIEDFGVITQTDDTVVAFDSSKDLSFESKSVGTEAQAINVNVAGNVSVTGNRSGSAYINGKDSNLSISRVSNVQDLVVTGDKQINLNDRVSVLKSIGITAEEGIIQSATSQLINTGDGGIVLTNNSAGDISLGNVTISKGVLDINNNAVGSVNVNGNINATGSAYVDIYSAGGYQQTGNIVANGVNADNNSINIDVVGDASVGQITTANGIKLSAGSVLLNNLLKSNNADIDVQSTTTIMQNGTDKTLQAQGDVKLSALGDIGSEEQSIVASSLSDIIATSTGGGVSLTGDNTNVELNNISAATDLRISTLGNANIIFNKDLSNINGDVLFATDGDLTIDSGINSDGSITLTSNSGDIILNALLKSTNEDVVLSAQGGIYQDSGYNEVAIDSKNVTLVANTGDVGANDSSIQIKSSGFVTVEGGNVYLQSSDNMNIAAINAGKDSPDTIVQLLTTDANKGNINFSGVVKGSDITINSAQGISQSVSEKTLDASGNVNLVAGAGSIGTSEQAINFSAESVSANAAKSVVLLGEDVDINTSSITATENIDLTTKIVDATLGKGKITIANPLETANGYIKLDSAKALNINNNISAGQSVTILAQGGITQAADAVINSGTAGVAGTGNISIANSGSGQISLYDVTANQGNLVVTNNANDNIVLNSVVKSTAGNVLLDSNGNILQVSTTNPSVLSTGDIVLNAVNIGTVENSLLVNADGALYSDSQQLYVKDSDGDLTLGTLNIGNSANIVAGGNINQLDSSVDAIVSNGTINISSASGNIGNAPNDSLAVNISGSGKINADAKNIYLSGTKVSTGIINATDDININTSVKNGSVNINDNMTAGGDITILSGNGIGHNMGTISRTGNAEGTIQIGSTAGDVRLLSVINNNGTISIGATGDVVLASLVQSTGGNLEVGATGKIIQIVDGVTLLSDGDITLMAANNIGSAGNHLSVKTNTGSITSTSTNGSLYLKAVDTNLQSSKISAINGDIDLVTAGTGNIIVDAALATTNGSVSLVTDNDINLSDTVSASKNIFINAKGGDVLQSVGNDLALNAGSDIRINSSGNIGTADNALTLNANGVVSAEGSNIYLTSPNKNLSVSSINSDGDVAIKTTTAGNIKLSGPISGTDVVLDSAGGISQNIAGKSIDASGDLSLFAHSGSIGAQNNAISFTANSVIAEASDSVALKGENVNIDIASIEAGNSIDLTTVGSGQITLSRNLNAANGYIRLDAVDGLVLGDYSLTAKDDITLATDRGDITFNALVNATNGNIVLDAATGKITQGVNGSLVSGGDINLIAGNTIGELGNEIKVAATGKVSADGSNVYLTSPQSLNIGVVTSSGEISIGTTSGNIDIKESISGNNVTLNAKNSIIQTPETKTITATNKLNLIAQDGDIGTFDNAVKFESESVSATASNGSVILNGINTDINTNNITAKNNIDLSTTGSGKITVNKEISTDGYIKLAAADELLVENTITSNASDITLSSGQNMSLSSAITAATDIVISAQTGFVQASGDIVAQTGNVSINTSGGINQTGGSVSAALGNVVISNADSNIINLTSVSSGDTTNISSLGDILLTGINAQNGIIVTNNGTEAHVINLGALTTQNGQLSVTNSSGGNVVLSSLIESTNGSVVLNANGGNILQTNNDKAIQAGSDIFLNAKQVGSNDNKIVLNNGGALNSSSDDIYVQNNDGGLTLGVINATNTVNLVANGNIVQNNPTDASIVAGGAIDLKTNNSSSIGASSSNTLVVSTPAALTAQAGNVYISSNETLNLGSISSFDNIYIVTNGSEKNIVLKDLLTGSNVVLNSSAGILQDALLSKTIDAGSLTLIANNGSIGETGNAIDFTATGALSADASKAVVLNSVGKDLDTSSITAGTSIDLSTEGAGQISVSSNLTANNGYIRLDAVDGLELGNYSLTASDYIVLATDRGDIFLNSQLNAGNDISLDAAGKITQGIDGASLNAGKDIILKAGETIGESTKSIALTATGKVSAEGSNVYLTSPQSLKLGKVTSAGEVSIETTAGDIDIKETIIGNNVTLNAKHSVIQTSESKTITAINDLNLIAQEGDIGATNRAIKFEAGNVSATASNGSVVLNGTNTNIYTNNITAQNNIDLSTTESGNITVNNIVETDGYIKLDSADELFINNTVTSNASDVTLAAGKNVVLSSVVNATSGNVSVSARDSILQTVTGAVINSKVADLNANNIGNTDSYLNIAVSDKVNAAGQNIYLQSDQNTFNIGSVNAGVPIINQEVNIRSNTGSVNLKDVVNGNNVNITSAQNITQDSSLQKSIDANTITLTAQNDVGVADNYLDVNANDRINVNSSNNVYVNGVENTLNTGTINATNNANITSEKGINLKGLISALWAKLTAKDSITQDSTLVKSIDATNLELKSENANIGETHNAIDFKTTTLKAEASNGSVVLNGVETDISTDSIVAGESIDLSTETSGNITIAKDITANGYIRLNSAEGLNVSNALMAGDSIELVAQNGNVVLSAIVKSTNDSINVTSNTGSITQSINSTSLSAKNDINLSAYNSVGDSSQSLVIDAGRNIALEASDVYLSGQNSNLNIVTINQNRADKKVGIFDVNTLGAGDITINDNLTANLIDVNSAGAISAHKNLNSQSIDLTAGGPVLTAGDITTVQDTNIVSNSSVSVKEITAKNVNIEASGTINIDDNLTAENLVKANSGDSIVAGGDITGSTVTLLSDGAFITSGNVIARDGLTITGASVTQLSADKMISNNNGLLSISSTNGSMNIASDINSSNGNISLSSVGGEITIANVESTNGLLSINSGGGVTASGLNAMSDISVQTNNGNILLNNIVSSTNGNVSISNDAANGNVTINGVNANSYSITNNANGLININGTLTNNVDSTISANNSGQNSGIVIDDSSVLNNNAVLNISNKGQSGTKLGGKINNSTTDSSSVIITNNAGSLNLTADIDNGTTNNIQVTNYGVDSEGQGLVFKDGTIINGGSLAFENNAGTMILAGQIDSKVGSVNNFVNGSNNDFVINTDMNVIGNTLTFENKGEGSLIVGELADISVADDGASQGILNIITSTDKTSGSLDINGRIMNATGSGGVLNITNNRIDGININDGANISIKNVNIYNTSGNVNVSDNVSVSAGDTLAVYNSAVGSDININGQLNGSDIVINSKDSNLNIAHNKTNGNIVATNNVLINADNANITNSSTIPLPNTIGITAGNDLVMVANNIGAMDSTLTNVINNGFVLDKNNAINVNAGSISANAMDALNMRSENGLNIESATAQNALLTAVNGSINANNIDVENLYLYAMADTGNISVSELSTSNLVGEAGADISINSPSTLAVDSLLSRNASINIVSDGNTEINEIAADKDITIKVNDEKLSIINLGKVNRANSIIPETVNLTVNDAKNISTDKNGKLDIYNAFVQDKVTLKADTITAQVYDISDSSVSGQKRVDKFGNEATGFHNANKDGELLVFDIQGANYQQGDVGSIPHNPNYVYDENDKKALSVHLTLGDSVDNAEYGANFEKLYADYAFIDSVNNAEPGKISEINIQNGVIGQYGIIRNNNLRLDIKNSPEQDFAINKHYNDAPDKAITNKTSFNSTMFEDVVIDDPVIPVPEAISNYNPHRLVENPDLDKKLRPTIAKVEDNSVVKAEASTGLKNINWVVRDKNNNIIGASNPKQPFEIIAINSISKSGITVNTNSLNDIELKKGDKLHIDMKCNEIGFNVDAKVKAVNGNIVQIDFINADKLSKTILMFLAMYQENL